VALETQLLLKWSAMQSTQLHETDAKASIWAAGLSFAVAAFALCQARAGLAALIAMSCGFALVFRRLRQEREALDERLHLPAQLELARELLQRGAHRQALTAAHAVAERARSAPLQRAAVELAAWCELGLGRPHAARDALTWLSGGDAADPYCLAAVEEACGQALYALHILEWAARRRRLSREATRFRIDLYAQLRGLDAACRLASAELERILPEDAEQVLNAARRAGCESASALAAALARQIEATLIC
jgi:hypothetical protein